MRLGYRQRPLSLQALTLNARKYRFGHYRITVRDRSLRCLVSLVVVGCLALSVTATALGDQASDKAGVYVRCCSPSATASWEQWRGAPAFKVVDFLQDDVTGVSGSSLDWWISQWKGSPYRTRLVVSVPLPEEYNLRDCAAMKYDATWQTLGRKLAANGMGGVVIRPLWEMNGAWHRWNGLQDPAAYRQCFARLVWSMRSVGAGWWKFVWNPDAGQPNPDAMYPGDRVVDIVALDAYDVAGWPWIRGGTTGLDSWLKPFAAAHGKQIAIPEWGLWPGHGDDLAYVASMMAWLDAQPNLAFHGMWEPTANFLLGMNPLSAAAFLS